MYCPALFPISHGRSLFCYYFPLLPDMDLIKNMTVYGFCINICNLFTQYILCIWYAHKTPNHLYWFQMRRLSYIYWQHFFCLWTFWYLKGGSIAIMAHHTQSWSMYTNGNFWHDHAVSDCVWYCMSCFTHRVKGDGTIVTYGHMTLSAWQCMGTWMTNDTQSSHSMPNRCRGRRSSINFRWSFFIQTEHTRHCGKQNVMIITIDKLVQCLQF